MWLFYRSMFAGHPCEREGVGEGCVGWVQFSSVPFVLLRSVQFGRSQECVLIVFFLHRRRKVNKREGVCVCVCVCVLSPCWARVRMYGARGAGARGVGVGGQGTEVPHSTTALPVQSPSQKDLSQECLCR